MGNSMSDEYTTPPPQPERPFYAAKEKLLLEMGLLDSAAREARGNYEKGELLKDLNRELGKLLNEHGAAGMPKSVKVLITTLRERIDKALK